nr:ATP-grasp fold amidoligase family protein [Nesterenkonia lacusekhoensis]
MARRRQLSRHFGPETFVTDKLRGEKFARNLGLPTALAYDEVFTAETLPIVPGTVIKPRGELGSRGVFILGEDSSIYDVQKSQYVGDEMQVREIISALVTGEPSEKLRGRGRVGRDEWIVERAIFDSQDESLPARDLKFFVFYGKVAAILEIMRFPEKKYCWWDAYGNQVKTGIYDEYDWVGEGVSEAEIAVASRVSSEIPGPFMRLDFLRGRDGLILGEFSGGVGEYHKFNTHWDHHLGELFLDAEGRLTSDLLTGKKFEDYSEFSDAHYRHYPAIHDQRYILSVKSDLLSAARDVEDFCRANAIRGYVSRFCAGQDELEIVARTGSRRLERLEKHFQELELAGNVAKVKKVPYYGAFPGQLLFQNSVR